LRSGVLVSCEEQRRNHGSSELHSPAVFGNTI
jgi:hypothetical protein